MSNYPKTFSEYDVNSLKNNDSLHSNLHWDLGVEINNSVGRVDIKNARKYEAVNTNDHPSYYAVLTDGISTYAEIPIYSYTYTEKLGICGENNINNYNVFVPIIHDSDLIYTSSIQNFGLVGNHTAISNKDYITTYSNITYNCTLIKNYNNSNTQEYNYYPYNHYPNPYDPYHDLHYALQYFMFPTDYQISNDPSLSNVGGINVNTDVLRIGASYTYLKNGDIFNGKVTDNESQIVYLWFAKSTPSRYIYSYGKTGLVSKIDVENNYQSEPNPPYIDLSNDNKVTIETHNKLSQEEKDYLCNSLTEVYGDDREMRSDRITNTPYGCGDNGLKDIEFNSYYGYRGFLDTVTNSHKFDFLPEPEDSNTILFNSNTSYPYRIPKSNFEPIYKLGQILKEPKNHNNGIGIILRSYCHVMENKYKNYYGVDLSGMNIDTNNTFIYPAKFYDFSKMTYHDTKISAPFNVYEKITKTTGGVVKCVLPIMIRLNVRNYNVSNLKISGRPYVKINLQYKDIGSTNYTDITSQNQTFNFTNPGTTINTSNAFVNVTTINNNIDLGSNISSKGHMYQFKISMNVYNLRFIGKRMGINGEESITDTDDLNVSNMNDSILSLYNEDFGGIPTTLPTADLPSPYFLTFLNVHNPSVGNYEISGMDITDSVITENIIHNSLNGIVDKHGIVYKYEDLFYTNFNPVVTCLVYDLNVSVGTVNYDPNSVNSGTSGGNSGSGQGGHGSGPSHNIDDM